MKITIHIEDATAEILSLLASGKDNKPSLVYKNSNPDNLVIPQLAPPHGLKKDGTPAKKRGRPAGTFKKKGKA